MTYFYMLVTFFFLKYFIYSKNLTYGQLLRYEILTYINIFQIFLLHFELCPISILTYGNFSIAHIK